MFPGVTRCLAAQGLTPPFPSFSMANSVAWSGITSLAAALQQRCPWDRADL